MPSHASSLFSLPLSPVLTSLPDVVIFALSGNALGRRAKEGQIAFSICGGRSIQVLLPHSLTRYTYLIHAFRACVRLDSKPEHG